MHNPLNDMPTSGPEEDGWEQPVPFDMLAELPPFPDDALPPFLRAYCASITVSVQVPYDLPAVMTLGALSTAVAGKVEIEIKDGYREPLNLWMLSILESGNRKTMVVGLAKSPIVAWEAEREAVMGPEVAQARTLYDIRQAGLTKAKAMAAGAKTDLDGRLVAEADAIALAQEVESMTIPTPPRLLTADVTAEALAGLIAAQHGRMAIISDEGDIFKLMAGRYSSGIPNIGIYKAGHAGGEYLVDRVGRPAVKIPKALLTVAVSPQPITVKGLTLKPEFRGEGLIARMMFSYPVSRIGSRIADTPALDQGLSDAYARRVRVLLDLDAPLTPEGWYDPHILMLSPEARVRWMRFFDATEARLGEGKDLYSIRDWGSKLNGAVARIAGVLHMASYHSPDDAIQTPVAGETMLAAIQISNYFIPHALYAFGEMGAGIARSGAQTILTWIERRGCTEFKERDAWVDLHRRFEERSHLEEALAYLVDRGYLRAAPEAEKSDESRKRGGRTPTTTYQVNPLKPLETARDGGFVANVAFVTTPERKIMDVEPISAPSFTEGNPSQKPQKPQNLSTIRSTDDDLL